MASEQAGRDGGAGSASAPLPSSPQRNVGLALFASGVGVLGVGAVLAVLAHDPPLRWLSTHPWQLVVLALALALGELKPIPVSRGDDTVSPVTISTTFAVALIVLGPLSWLLLVHTLAVGLDDLRGGRRPLQILFNAGQYALSIVTARAVFCLLTGTPLLGGYTEFSVGDLVPALVAGAVFALANDSLVAVVVALASGQRVSTMLREDVRFKLETSGVLVALAPLAALLADASLLMLPLLALPVLAVRRAAHLAVLRERQSLHDPLTGLANRELFRRRVERALASAPGEDRGVALLMVDMDHFKDVNDILGHHVGDQLLREIAGRIERAAVPYGENATVARLGGDEFAVVLTDAQPVAAAEHLAESLLALMARPVDIPGQRLSIQGSIGLTTTAGRSVDVHGLLSEADIALYEAKRERARYRVFEPGTVTGSAERLVLLPRLREAVERGELEVVYQPQLDVRDGRVMTVESLVRWDHPTQGRLGPDTFIELAESAGLIGALTSHVLSVSVQAASEWRRRGWDVGISVNLSARQLTDQSLPREVAGLLHRWGLPASHLTIEVTESSLMEDARQASAVLRALREMGVRLAIDDFGTGYSSLVLLQRLDVDELKIDRSFVAGLVRGSHDEILVRSIIDLGHNLGLGVVAEGVETSTVAEHLSAMGCDRLQGYLFGRPMPEEAITALLAAQHAVERHAATHGEVAGRPAVRDAAAARPLLRAVGGKGVGV